MCCARVFSFLLARVTTGLQLLLLTRATILWLRRNSLLSIRKHLAILRGPWHNHFHNFRGKSDSVFRGHAMPPVLILGHDGGKNGGTMAVPVIVPQDRAGEIVV